MARSSRKKSSAVASSAILHVPEELVGAFEIDTGQARIAKDPYSHNGWVLWINGVQSSHISEDPAVLEFEYMQWISHITNHHFSDPDAPLNFLHLGGGACSLARWGLAVYPHSRHVVVEIDARLATRVREAFDLPRAPRLRIRAGEARQVTETLTESSRHVIIRDVFAGSETPRSLTTVEFLQQAKRLLVPGGLYLANIGDSPALRGVREEMATTARVFEHVLAVSDPPMFKGRRSGNVILAASDAPLDSDAALNRKLLGAAVPAQAWGAERIAEFSRGAIIREDEEPQEPTPQSAA